MPRLLVSRSLTYVAASLARGHTDRCMQVLEGILTNKEAWQKCEYEAIEFRQLISENWERHSWADTAADQGAGGQRSRAHCGSILTP